MKEKDFEGTIRNYLAVKGAYSVKYHGNMYSTNGTPDILASINGYFVAIEVKGDGGKPTELQREKINDIRRSGGFGYIVWPSGWDALRTIIDGLYHDEFNREEGPDLR